MDWYVYLLRALVKDREVLYCGASTDPPRRVKEHGGPRGAKYLRGAKNIRLVWQSGSLSKSAAHSLERMIKRVRREAKEALIRGRALEAIHVEEEPEEVACAGGV